mgnify:CR=1 FL=1
MTDSSAAELLAAARAGSPRALARLISWIEDGSPRLGELARLITGPDTARVIGLTGAPGVGKSTTTNALVGALRATGQRVAVLAVDPSSPFSGGALLGDRVRMTEHAADPGVYIRSMASRGHLGGLAAAAPMAIRLLEAVGFDAILVETVGVGQSEVEIAGEADSTVVLLAPGMGDGIQAAKAGLLEVGDVYVVNKADRDGAEAVRRDLRSMIGLTERAAHDWRPPIVMAVALDKRGIDELVEALAAHREWAQSSGAFLSKRRERARREISALAWARLQQGWAGWSGIETLAASVAAGELDVYTAVDRLLAAR